MSKRRIIPLPIYKADPQSYPEALFRVKQVSAGTLVSYRYWHSMCICVIRCSVNVKLRTLFKCV